ncbi:MAG: transporter [Candidatus Taylorbacteria bacterium RIFCSPLOWO2_12_FULL_44_15c]|uniref:Probable queuosine precursor transporter n=1 Tax=Candidatus Taylorbacteria bacterium RIFCSPLOWO2_12_FULL_44_15c TaxID=1802333 RepID=A0A1G2P7F0_9BACT|nr:MAG: transporter [Candidatus Taylorbacteria bacterium RIFCSPLOWO2_12_FULL_44_15c]
MKHYKLLGLLTALNITFQLVSDVTAGKIIELFIFPVSVTVLYFPFVYIISDVMTEVYGYARARLVTWLTLISSVIAGLIYLAVAYLPSPEFFGASEAYATVFGIVPRVLVGGWIAVFAGDILNNYVLAKMKVWTKGRHLWTRTIGSTIFGQGANTVLFYVIALSGILPTNVLVASILSAWLLKIAVEAIFTPATYYVVRKVKQIESEDHYDTDTDFNPLSFKVKD